MWAVLKQVQISAVNGSAEPRELHLMCDFGEQAAVLPLPGLARE